MGNKKKYLIVSDTHGQNDTLYRVIASEKPLTGLIHCGDFESTQFDELKKLAECEVYMVAGNNDYGLDLPDQRIIDIGGMRTLVLHGHKQRLYAGFLPLCYLAEEKQADMVIFGHLHRPCIDNCKGVILLNPGSLTYPRQAELQPTYITITIDESGELHHSLHTI